MKYKLVNGWTKEKVMEQVRKYNNGTQAVKDGTCLYNHNSNRCAIGCFIPDGHPALGSRERVITLLSDYPDLISYMPFSDSDALRYFQRSHDVCDMGHFNGDTYFAIQNFLDIQVSDD